MMGIVGRTLVLAAAAVATIGATAAEAELLRIRYAVWVGYGPLFLAKEKGFFEREGVDVELVELDDHTAAFAAFNAGQVDAMAAATVEAVSFHTGDENTPACAMVRDYSHGGDGVLAVNEIQTLADLRGRPVAYHANGISEFYINVLLREAGITQEDIDHIDLPTDQAVEAFILEEVDAAVA